MHIVLKRLAHGPAGIPFSRNIIPGHLSFGSRQLFRVSYTRFDQVDQNLNPLHGICPETESAASAGRDNIGRRTAVGNDPIDIILVIKCGARCV